MPMTQKGSLYGDICFIEKNSGMFSRKEIGNYSKVLRAMKLS